MHCATVGTLWIRDGIPLLEPGGNNTTFGALVYFRPADAALAYQRISEIEPDEQYYWGEIDATYRTSHRDLAETANALIGRKPQRGSRGFEGVDWDGRDDPLFNEGLDVIEETLNKNREFHDDLKRLFRLQMAYLLLWSAIERYAGLRYLCLATIQNAPGAVHTQEFLTSGPNFSVALNGQTRGTSS